MLPKVRKPDAKFKKGTNTLSNHCIGAKKKSKMGFNAFVFNTSRLWPMEKGLSYLIVPLVTTLLRGDGTVLIGSSNSGFRLGFG